MPNLYDRAVCATELNLRNRILSKIHGGRAPTHAFEVPNENGEGMGPDHTTLAASSADTTSVTATASFAKKGDRHFQIGRGLAFLHEPSRRARSPWPLDSMSFVTLFEH